MKSFLQRHKLFSILILLTIATIAINQFPRFIESFYSEGIYPYIAHGMRLLLGWLPFSIGDLLYGFLAIVIIVKIIRFVILWRKGRLANGKWKRHAFNTVTTLLFVYVLFNWMWGFNYNRLGSAYQFQLRPELYSMADLEEFTDTLQSRLAVVCSDSTTLAQSIFDDVSKVKLESQNDYALATKAYPFLSYQTISVKKATLRNLGNYLGFLGYINPITLEAQLNQNIPHFFVPYVCCHEMAHQLGYASESEANLIGYMACKQSSQPQFRYSVYYDLMSYALGELASRDTIVARQYYNRLPQKVKDDRKLARDYFKRFKNPVSPMIDWMYDKYLKLNNQPHGRGSYNEVVGWIIAYAKKYGWDKV